MNLRKVANANDVQISAQSVSGSNIATNGCSSGCPVLGPSSQIEAAENTVLNTDPTSPSKLIFEMSKFFET